MPPAHSSGGLQVASFTRDGEPAVYYDGGRHVVRLLHRVYRLPPKGRTLVLLVDEGGGTGATPHTTVRGVPAPVTPTPSLVASGTW